MCMFVLINELPVYRFLLMLTSPGRLLSGFQLQVRHPTASIFRSSLRPARDVKCSECCLPMGVVDARKLPQRPWLRWFNVHIVDSRSL